MSLLQAATASLAADAYHGNAMKDHGARKCDCWSLKMKAGLRNSCDGD